MFGVSGLVGVAEYAASIARRIRGSIGEARSLAESRANTLMSSLSSIVERIGFIAGRIACIAEARGASGPYASVCSSWRIVSSDGRVMVLRVKPATVIVLSGGVLRFARSGALLEASGTKLRLCKRGFCEEVDAADRREVLERLSELSYLVREVGLYVEKSLNSVMLCARREAPSCR